MMRAEKGTGNAGMWKDSRNKATGYQENKLVCIH